LARKPYTVENQRPRRTVNLYGTVLAPAGRGRTSCTDLSLDQVLGPACLRLLSVGRLRVVRGDMALVEAELEKLAAPEEPTPIAVEEEPAPPAKETKSEEDEDSGEEEEQPEVDEVPESTTPEHAERGEEGSETDEGTQEPASSPQWTEEDLSGLGYRELQKLCKELEISAAGSTEDLIERILESQEGA